MIWFVFALLVALACVLTIWPLGQRVPVDSDAYKEAYQATLTSASRDVERGAMTSEDFDAARNRAARLLLSHVSDSAQNSGNSGVKRARWTSVLVVLVVPALTYALYERLGNGNRLGEFHAAMRPEPEIDFDSAIKKVEAHLKQYPEDGAGYEVIAPVYLRLERFSDAATAWRQSIKLLGETPERKANLLEALILADQGTVSTEAEALAAEILAKTPNNPKAKFYSAMAAYQHGQRSRALEIWQEMVRTAPPDAPWLETVKRRIASASGSAADGLSDQNATMIRSMVANLAAKLEKDPANLDGWLRLIRSYTVLNQADEARQALAKARSQFASDPNALHDIDALAKSLELSQ